ncbi:MAG: acylneuraminate cytidylyltransferase family protein [Alphaproteobacteria bacterium]|nr:acylneuraminate cytidylyltransferase family protein [Alphaproteobacteria bacterium]
MSVIAFIFARGGSKGIPRKNLCLLGDKPLLAWSIDAAVACPGVTRVVVSTDDTEIAAVARQYGAETPFIRPAELSGDRSPEWLAWRHAADFIMSRDGGFDTFLSVPTTSPLRAIEDLSNCLAALDTTCDAVISVTPAARNPYFNIVRQKDDGTVEIAVRSEESFSTRQSTPKMYDITTVAYATRPSYIQSAQSLFEGRVKAVVVPKERSLDIDDVLDLEFARFMIQSRGKPHE